MSAGITWSEPVDPGRATPRYLHLVLLVLYAVGLAVGGIGARLTGMAAALLLPGPALLALIGLRRGLVRDLVAGVALSPLVIGAAVTLPGLLGWDAGPWVHAVILAAGLGLTGEGWRRRAMPSSGSLGISPWLVGAVFASLVAVVMLPHEARRLGSDAWFHSAVVFEVQRNGLPPGDPYFAGLPLQYFWFFHAVLVGFLHAAGSSPAATMTLLNIVAAGLCIPAAVRLGRAVGVSRASGVWGGVMLLLGMGGLFWLLFPIRFAGAMVGENRGWAVVRDILNITPLTPTSTRELLQILGSPGFLLKKFLVGTPTSWTLLLLVIAAAFAVIFLREGRRRDLIGFWFTAVGAFLLHVVIGGASLAAMTGSAGLLFLLGAARRRAGLLTLAGVAAFAAGLPYVLSLTYGSATAETPFPLGVDLRYWLALPGALGAVLFLFLLGRRSLGPAPGYRFLQFWALAASVYALFARLPSSNQYDKPPLVLFVPLALAAGFGIPALWARGGGRRRLLLAIFLALVLVPENALRWAAFSVEPVPPAPTAADRDLYEWIGANTREDAVFIDTKERVDVLVRGPRRQFWGVETYAVHWRYTQEEIDSRRRTVEAVYADRPLAARDLAPLLEVNGPVYLLAREADHPGIGLRLAARDDLFAPVYETRDTRVFTLRKDGLSTDD